MYDEFAYVYDELMDNVPYQRWADMLHSLIIKYGISRPGIHGSFGDSAEPSCEEERLESERNLVLDLACGTGTLTELMHQKGYDMIGVDISGDMLNAAMEKRDKSGSDILYLNQDMRELDLFSTVGTIYCLCDSINYLLSDEDIGKVFALCENFLYPGGLFIFDFNTVFKYESIIGDRTIAENREDVSFIWENYYYPEEHINEYDLTVFIESRERKGFYRKITETHLQKGYTLNEIEGFLERAGLEMITAFELSENEEETDKTFKESDILPCVSGEQERIFVVSRKRTTIVNDKNNLSFTIKPPAEQFDICLQISNKCARIL